MKENKKKQSAEEKTELERKWEEAERKGYPGEGADETVPTGDSKEAQELKLKLAEAEDRVLRATAEFENSRKRMQKRSEDAVKYANEKLILDVLPVIDDLDRAISSLDRGDEAKSVLEGLHMIQGTFHRILEQNGVQAIECQGVAFDPNFHEAVAEVETDEVEEGCVVEEFQRGYTLNERLARPSKVRIAKKKA